MAHELDGYGDAPGDRGVDRLLADLRELDRSGLERVFRAWEKGEARDGESAYLTAEQAGLALIKADGRSHEWEAARDAVLRLTRGGAALATWRSEPGSVEEAGERAAMGAALALVAGDRLAPQHGRVLLRPLAAALPWLAEEGDLD